jgi:type VI protein secretion system component Hcp
MAKSSQFLNLIDRRGQPVLGECIDADHKDEIDVNGWNWSVEDPAALPKSENADATDDARTSQLASKTDSAADTKITPSVLTITKRTDRSTCRFIQAMDQGEIFPSATLVIEEEFKESPSPFYLSLELTDVLIVKFDLSVDAGNASTDFKESWDLNYKSLIFTYRMRGLGQKGFVALEFEKPRESAASASKKSPLSTSEKKSQRDSEIAEWARRNGWKPPGKS